MSLEPEPSPGTNPSSEILSRRRLVLVFVVLLAEVALFFAGLLTPLSEGTRQALVNQTGSQFGNIQNGSAVQLVGFIFTHNASIAIPEMIPIVGALLLAVSVFTTGLAAQALVAAQGLPVQWGAVIFAFPYSLVELTGYAVALASGIMLLSAWRKGRLKQELRVFVVEGVAVAAILLVAAAMEAATVRISFIVGFALWLPTGAAIAAVILVAGRKKQ